MQPSQPAMCASKRARSAEWQRVVEVLGHELDELLAAELIGDLGHASSMRYASSARAHLRAGTVQEHPLVCLRKLECVTDLLGAPTLDVAEGDHCALRGRQTLDRVSDHPQSLSTEEPLLGPALRRRSPLPVDEAVGIDRGLELERRERSRARLPLPACLRPVRDDAEDPRLERRAALEAVDAVQDGDPALLHDVLRDRPARDVHQRHAQEGGLVHADELLERLLVPVAERLDESHLLELERVLHATDCNEWRLTTD